MKNRIAVVTLVALISIPAFPTSAGAAEAEWVRIPVKWLLHRFVRPSTAPARTYRVALVVPPGSKQAKVAKSSGIPDVDQVAADYAISSIENNAALRALAKSKELYFQFVVTPPMLDVKMRSVEGKRPAPPGKEVYMPIADTFLTSANQNETTSRTGKLAVIFPPEGGYASEAIVTLSTGNPAVDRYYLHGAALNWQTTRKSANQQIFRTTFGAAALQRWQTVYDR